MHHKKNWFVVVIAVFLLVVTGIITGGALAQDDGDAGSADSADNENTSGGPSNLGADYLGTEVCLACHSDVADSWFTTAHAQTLKEANAETVLGDLSDTAALTITWPDGAERPITLDDISYVVGYRHTQQYISIQRREDGTNAFYVLPVMWNIPQEESQTGVWTAYFPDDWTAPERDWRTACAGCHTAGLTPEVMDTDWVEGDAVEFGVACEACHGPGGEHIKKPSVGNIVSAPDAQICGQCHSVGTDPSGVHGYPVGYQPGMTLDETVFVPVGRDDTEVWWASGHAKLSNHYAEWLNTKHATALDTMRSSEWAEDSCLRCHATQPASIDDADWTLENAEYGITCVACHDVHPMEGAGDQPHALRTDPYTLCATCHTCCQEDGSPLLVGGKLHHPVQGMFEGLQVVEGIEGIPSGHYGAMGEESCTHCHMTPTIQIGVYGSAASHALTIAPSGPIEEGQPDSCTGCHTNISPEAMQQHIQDTQESIALRLQTTNEALRSNPDAPGWVTRALEFVETDGSLGIHNYAYIDTLLYKIEAQLGLVQNNGLTSVASVTAEDPENCAECHHDVHDVWQNSPHANASLTDVFAQDRAASGQPTYCMRCHASGYDPDTEEYVFEGVVCSTCHTPVNGTEHPPGPMQASDASSACGQCHSGAHAPTYDEWLTSAHSTLGIDCVDCHTPHDNGLILGDVNATCGSCHPETLTDEVHMGEGMDCVDCHMPRHLDSDGIHVTATGHTMYIDPGTCAECHGNAHVLTKEDKAPETPEESLRIAALEDEVSELEDTAKTNWNTGVVGGAFGMLIVAVGGYLVLRRRR